MKKYHFFAAVSAVFAGGVLTAPATHAQALAHRYSFNGSATDSVGGANGTVIGSVTLESTSGVNGSAVFSGGTSGSSPGYISLPVSAVSGLQNATVEIFTTDFSAPNNQPNTAGGEYESLFSVGTAYGNQSNFINLTPNYAGDGLGFSAEANNANGSYITTNNPFPISWQDHVVDLVYSGFTGIGSTGTVTLYLDGVVVGQTATTDTFAALAAAPGGIANVGIGGGSPFDDPTFNGSISEVRIFSGALSAAQISADVADGPAVVGSVPITSSISGTVALEDVAAGNRGQSIVFTVTPTGTTTGSVTNQTVILNASTGAFTLTGIPPGTYTLGAKGSKWLRVDTPVDTTNGNVTGLTISLLGGDVNGNNSISLPDILQLLADYGSTPGTAKWNANADINCDGAVSLPDCLILLANYGKVGAP